jgi:hypothetical protein
MRIAGTTVNDGSLLSRALRRGEHSLQPVAAQIAGSAFALSLRLQPPTSRNIRHFR